MTAARRTHWFGRFCRATAWICLPTLVFLGGVASMAPSASAQNTLAEFKAAYPDWPYKIIPIPQHLLGSSVDGKMRLLIPMIMRDDPRPEKSLKANEKQFDEYFRDIIFRRCTHPNRLTEIKSDCLLVLRMLRTAKSSAARERLEGLIIDYMPRFADGDYHPALRYNAMLLLGELNSQEAVATGDKAPAVPLTSVLPILLEHATKAEMIDAVRVAALIGIGRHAESPLPATAKTKIIGDLLPLLAPEPPPGRSPKGHDWIRRQVVEILGAIGDADIGKVAPQLRNIMVDASQPLSLRCSAAMALGQLPPAGDVKQLAGEVGAVGVEACRVELTWLKGRVEQRQKELAEPVKPAGRGARPGRNDVEALFGGGGGGGGAVVTAGDPVLSRCSTLARRRLKTRLNSVKTALNDLSGRAGPARSEVDTVIAGVDNVANVLDDPDMEPEALHQSVLGEATKLESLVKNMAGPAKAPATAPKAGAATPPAAAQPDVPEDIPF